MHLLIDIHMLPTDRHPCAASGYNFEHNCSGIYCISLKGKGLPVGIIDYQCFLSSLQLLCHPVFLFTQTKLDFPIFKNKVAAPTAKLRVFPSTTKQ